MDVEASMEPENISSLLSKRIAEGKRNEESYGQVLSLQDVFSESENSLGIQQKTSCLFRYEQGIWRNLRQK